MNKEGRIVVRAPRAFIEQISRHVAALDPWGIENVSQYVRDAIATRMKAEIKSGAVPAEETK